MSFGTRLVPLDASQAAVHSYLDLDSATDELRVSPMGADSARIERAQCKEDNKVYATYATEAFCRHGAKIALLETGVNCVLSAVD